MSHETDEFIEYVVKGRLGEAEVFLNRHEGFDIDYKDEIGRSAFHHAVENGLVDRERFLVTYGADVNNWLKTEDIGWTTGLEIALNKNDVPSVLTILEAPSFDSDKHKGVWTGIPRKARIGYQDSDETNVLPSKNPENPNSDEICDLDWRSMKKLKTGKWFFVAVNQDLNELFKKDAPHSDLSSFISFGCNNVPELNSVLSQTQPSVLTSLYVMDCSVKELANWSAIQKCSNLEVLCLSDNKIKHLPSHLLTLKKLKVLKVDRNKLSYLPDALGDLESLVSFSCDHNKLVSIPRSISKLQQLESLTCSHNKIERIDWLVALTKLKVFRCDNNDVAYIPAGIDDMSLPALNVLDISHNNLHTIPVTLISLINKVNVFTYYSSSLKMRGKFKRNRKLLTDELEKQRKSFRDADTVETKVLNAVFIGSSFSGKTTLISALSSDKGIGQASPKTGLPFGIHQLEMCETNSKESYSISAFNLNADYLDDFSRGVAEADVYVVPIAINKLASSVKGGISGNHLDGIQLWLNAIADVMETIGRSSPVMIVGTHADLVESKVRLKEIWVRLRRFLFARKDEHMKCHDYHPDCLMCNADKNGLVRKSRKDANGLGGLVLNWSEENNQPELMIDDIEDYGISTPTDDCNTNKCRLVIPHIVGYHEVCSIKVYPNTKNPFKPVKGAKMDNWSIDMLRLSFLWQIIKLNSSEAIPKNWVQAGKYFQKLALDHTQLPVRSYKDVRGSLVDMFAIHKRDVLQLLQRFHKRGIILHFADSDVLNNVVVLNPAWLSLKLKEQSSRPSRHGMKSIYELDELRSFLYDDDLARIINNIKAGSSCFEWFLAALLKFDVCRQLSHSSYFFPDLLPRGVPDWHVWPDCPDEEQRHLTYEVKLRSVDPSMFQELIWNFLVAGQKDLKLVLRPHPFLLRADVVFISEIKPDCCTFCKNVDKACLSSMRHRIRIQLVPYVDVLRVSVRGNKPCCVMRLVVSFVNRYLRSYIKGRNYESWDIDCPKCVMTSENDMKKFPLSRLVDKVKRKSLNPICSYWHDLGCWEDVLCGRVAVLKTYKLSRELIQNTSDFEHPKLFVLLRDDVQSSFQNWLMFSKLGFLDGYTLHLLCECPNYWHFTESAGYDLQRPNDGKKQWLQTLVRVLKIVQVVLDVLLKIARGAMGGPIPQLASLLQSSTVLKEVIDGAGTTKDIAKDMSTYFEKMLKDFAGQYRDLNFTLTNGTSGNHMDEIFTETHSLSRRDLARFFKEHDGDGRFGSLTPLFIGNSVKWLCKEHYQLFKGVKL